MQVPYLGQIHSPCNVVPESDKICILHQEMSTQYVYVVGEVLSHFVKTLFTPLLPQPVHFLG